MKRTQAQIQPEKPMEGQLALQSAVRETTLPTPRELRSAIPLSPAARGAVAQGRSQLGDILSGRDPQRIAIVCGPCSIDDLNAALTYGELLRDLQDQVADKAVLVMRTYFEKPRSVMGWKGLLYAPGGLADDAGAAQPKGIELARRLLGQLNEMGLPCATEFLNPMLALYLEDAIAYGSIGSRTAESQIHRELASRLSLPVGIKNAMDGDPRSALCGVIAAQRPHTLFGLGLEGRPQMIETSGNPYAHVVLRGGSARSNYDPESIEAARSDLSDCGLGRPVIVDCSHGNSGKDHRRQAGVARCLAKQIASGQIGIAGLMLESYLEEGRQDAARGKPLMFGQSITDACIGWDETQRLILELADGL